MMALINFSGMKVGAMVSKLARVVQYSRIGVKTENKEKVKNLYDLNFKELLVLSRE